MRFPEIASPLVALVALAFAASTVGCAAQADPAQEASGENVRATAASLEGTTTIRVLEANVFASHTMNGAISPPPVVRLTARINSERYDFVTTQDNEQSLLTDPVYQLSPDYEMVGSPSAPAILYDATRWSLAPGGWRSVPMTSDAGPRVAVLARFRSNATGQEVTVGTTQLCVAFATSSGYASCIGDELRAHVADAQTLGDAATSLGQAGSPVIVTGELNNFANSAVQAQAMEQKLQAFGLEAVKTNGAFLGPTFAGLTTNFVYSKNATVKAASLYTAAEGNPSDHAALDVTFEVGGT
jgi:hypothetical protein